MDHNGGQLKREGKTLRRTPLLSLSPSRPSPFPRDVITKTFETSIHRSPSHHWHYCYCYCARRPSLLQFSTDGWDISPHIRIVRPRESLIDGTPKWLRGWIWLKKKKREREGETRRRDLFLLAPLEIFRIIHGVSPVSHTHIEMRRRKIFGSLDNRAAVACRARAREMVL